MWHTLCISIVLVALASLVVAFDMKQSLVEVRPKCPICLEDVAIDQKPLVDFLQLPCTHWYCKDCWKQALDVAVEVSCGICRAPYAGNGKHSFCEYLSRMHYFAQNSFGETIASHEGENILASPFVYCVEYQLAYLDHYLAVLLDAVTQTKGYMHAVTTSQSFSCPLKIKLLDDSVVELQNRRAIDNYLEARALEPYEVNFNYARYACKSSQGKSYHTIRKRYRNKKSNEYWLSMYALLQTCSKYLPDVAELHEINRYSSVPLAVFLDSRIFDLESKEGVDSFMETIQRRFFRPSDYYTFSCIDKEGNRLRFVSGYYDFSRNVSELDRYFGIASVYVDCFLSEPASNIEFLGLNTTMLKNTPLFSFFDVGDDIKSFVKLSMNHLRKASDEILSTSTWKCIGEDGAVIDSVCLNADQPQYIVMIVQSCFLVAASAGVPLAKIVRANDGSVALAYWQSHSTRLFKCDAPSCILETYKQAYADHLVECVNQHGIVYFKFPQLRCNLRKVVDVCTDKIASYAEEGGKKPVPTLQAIRRARAALEFHVGQQKFTLDSPENIAKAIEALGDDEVYIL